MITAAALITLFVSVPSPAYRVEISVRLVPASAPSVSVEVPAQPSSGEVGLNLCTLRTAILQAVAAASVESVRIPTTMPTEPKKMDKANVGEARPMETEASSREPNEYQIVDRLPDGKPRCSGYVRSKERQCMIGVDRVGERCQHHRNSR